MHERLRIEALQHEHHGGRAGTAPRPPAGVHCDVFGLRLASSSPLATREKPLANSKIELEFQCRSVSGPRDRNHLPKTGPFLLSELRIIHAQIGAAGVDARKIEYEFELDFLVVNALRAKFRTKVFK